MSDLRKDHAGVASSLPKRAKRRVNEKLIKNKEEILLENQGDECSDTELSFKYTQPIRSQQFYANMDTKLDGLNRDDYINELLRICRKDVSMLTDYRDRLAERAQTFPDCPQTWLVNRRNSSTGTREENVPSTVKFCMRTTMTSATVKF